MSSPTTLAPPDSTLCRQAETLLGEIVPQPLRNHCYRTFYLGESVGMSQGVSYDREVLYLSALLHDLGLTESHDASVRFEVRGADAAVELVKRHGLSDEKAEVVWDAIALHTSPGIADRKGPEATLVQLGAACDMMGAAYDTVGAETIDTIMAEFPREGIQNFFRDLILREVRAHPEQVTATWMSDLGRQCLDDVACPTWSDQVAASPYHE